MSAGEPTKVIKYFSRYPHGVDDKRRLQVPSKWRPEEGEVEFTVIIWPQHQAGTCLRVYPPHEFEALLAKIDGMDDADPQKLMLRRHVGSDSDQITPDKNGRIILPEHMAKAAGITDQALLCGAIKYWEIWNPARYENMKAMDASGAGNVFGRLG